MPRAVPAAWPNVPLRAARVAAPVASLFGSDLGGQLTWLQGAPKTIVGSVAGLPLANGTSHLRYYKSPGAIALLVTVLPNHAAAAGTAMDVTTTIRDNTGADTGADTLAGTTTVLDASSPIGCALTTTRHLSLYQRYFDVSALTVGTPYELRVVTATNGGGTSRGVYSISAYEIPRPAFACESSPSTEPGVNAVFATAGNPIFAGSGSTSGDVAAGMTRYIHEFDAIRANVKRFPINVCALEDTTHSWAVTSAVFADVPWGFAGTGTTPRFSTRTKALYATGATDNTLEVRARFSTSGAGKLTVRLIRESDGTTYDMTATSSAGVWTEATWAAALQTTATGHGDAFTVQALVGSGTGYLGALSVYDAEA